MTPNPPENFHASHPSHSFEKWGDAVTSWMACPCGATLGSSQAAEHCDFQVWTESELREKNMMIHDSHKIDRFATAHDPEFQGLCLRCHSEVGNAVLAIECVPKIRPLEKSEVTIHESHKVRQHRDNGPKKCNYCHARVGDPVLIIECVPKLRPLESVPCTCDGVYPKDPDRNCGGWSCRDCGGYITPERIKTARDAALQDGPAVHSSHRVATGCCQACGASLMDERIRVLCPKTDKKLRGHYPVDPTFLRPTTLRHEIEAMEPLTGGDSVDPKAACACSEAEHGTDTERAGAWRTGNPGWSCKRCGMFIEWTRLSPLPTPPDNAPQDLGDMVLKVGRGPVAVLAEYFFEHHDIARSFVDDQRELVRGMTAVNGWSFRIEEADDTDLHKLKAIIDEAKRTGFRKDNEHTFLRDYYPPITPPNEARKLAQRAREREMRERHMITGATPEECDDKAALEEMILGHARELVAAADRCTDDKPDPNLTVTDSRTPEAIAEYERSVSSEIDRQADATAAAIEKLEAAAKAGAFKDKEIDTMQRMSVELQGLDQAAQHRVLDYLRSRFGWTSTGASGFARGGIVKPGGIAIL